MEHKVQRQLTAAIENAPGRLSAICETLKQHGINIEGICTIDNIEQGVIRLLTSQPAESKRLLAEQHIYVVEADVLTLEVTDQLGALARIGAALAEHDINIDYMYGTVPQAGARTKMVFKVSDLAAAERILASLEVI